MEYEKNYETRIVKAGMKFLHEVAGCTCTGHQCNMEIKKQRFLTWT